MLPMHPNMLASLHCLEHGVFSALTSDLRMVSLPLWEFLKSILKESLAALARTGIVVFESPYVTILGDP